MLPANGLEMDASHQQQASEKRPSSERCRTVYLGQLFNLSECLVESPGQCPFALPFGHILLCGRRDCRKFESQPSLMTA
jgi:hypothetical protein